MSGPPFCNAAAPVSACLILVLVVFAAPFARASTFPLVASHSTTAHATSCTIAPNATVARTTTPTATYTATLDRVAVTPATVSPAFGAGNITITRATGVTTNTDLWVYDANFNAIAGYGNDDPSTSSTGATLTRNFNPGTYYL